MQSAPRSTPLWTSAWRPMVGILTMVFLGCAGFLPAPQNPETSASPAAAAEPMPLRPIATPARQFDPPAELDRMLDAHTPPLSPVTPATVQATDLSGSAATPEAPPEAGGFCVQIDAIANLDSAQTRKAQLEKTLGEPVDMSFDPPYYKLRLGNFATRLEAEDKLVDLEAKNLHGFIVRQ